MVSPLEFHVSIVDNCNSTSGVADNHATEPCARTGFVSLRRGIISTPAFMPVGTYGAMRGLTVEQLLQTKSQIMLCNAWHLSVRPGARSINKLGGLHEFTGWKKPILTDSGGFQIMSLSSSVKVSDDSVYFKSHIDGSVHQLSPEDSLYNQILLDSDIAMQLDHCVKASSTYEETRSAMIRSLAWAERTREVMKPNRKISVFGIVQGGIHDDLRKESATKLVSQDFDGYSIGGLAVGEGHENMIKTIANTTALLPKDKPRYLMGSGTPWDIIEAVKFGIDMFDCVMPTREGRHGNIYTNDGKIKIRNAKFAGDSSPIDPKAKFGPATEISRAYLHHLFKSEEMLGPTLASMINISFYQQLMQEIRHNIIKGSYSDYMLKQKQIWGPQN